MDRLVEVDPVVTQDVLDLAPEPEAARLKPPYDPDCVTGTRGPVRFKGLFGCPLDSFTAVIAFSFLKVKLPATASVCVNSLVFAKKSGIQIGLGEPFGFLLKPEEQAINTRSRSFLEH